MMLTQNKTRIHYIIATVVSSLVISACSDSGTVTPPPAASYEVTVTNASNNQPLSPVAVIVHDDSFSAWSVGSTASTELEYIAEDGSNTQLLASLSSTQASSASGAVAIGPGESDTITVTAGATTQTFITIASMLVNTNDAFSGLRSVDVSGLSSGDSIMLSASVYDAGTELNSESAGTIPGPADGGEGFSAARTDINDVVRGHGGVVTVDDGLSSSVLDQSHRFDNPGMMVRINRI